MHSRSDKGEKDEILPNLVAATENTEPPLVRLRRFFSRRFRPQRLQRFLKTHQPQPTETILDIGGTDGFWEGAPNLQNVTLLNITPMVNCPKRFKEVIGDGTSLNFKDGAFAIVHSNSVIEHVGDFKRQQAFASEARRVGRKLWIQTPARNFLVEPHFIDFFCHWLPRGLRRKMIRHWTLWGWLAKPSQEMVDQMLDEIRLLNRSEMVMLFPDCRIETERVCGWAKSYIAIRD